MSMLITQCRYNDLGTSCKILSGKVIRKASNHLDDLAAVYQSRKTLGHDLSVAVLPCKKFVPPAE